MNKRFALPTQRKMHPMTHPLLLHVRSLIRTPIAYAKAWQTRLGYGGNTHRWSQTKNFDEAWDERTAQMAAMITPGASVLEFGSGREQLERFLPAGCQYQPSDLVARSSRTLVCDLNQGFPSLSQRYDVIVFSGVIEYIHDIEALFRQVYTVADQCIVSYAPTDQLRCMATRIASGWVNHMSEEKLLRYAERVGFHCEERKIWKNQTIYRLVARQT